MLSRMDSSKRAPDDESRENALLTRSQREYLKGPPATNKNTDRKQRQRIRNRVRNGLKDFTLLAHGLEKRDRRQLFSKEQLKAIHAFKPDRVFRSDELAGLIHTFAFLYAILLELNGDPEEYLEVAIGIANRDILDNAWGLEKIKVEIKDEPIVDIDEAFEKLDKDIELTEPEYYTLLHFIGKDPELFIEKTSIVDLQIQEAVRDERQLSRGQSLVAYARGFVDSDWTDSSDLQVVIHPQVLRSFGVITRMDSNRPPDDGQSDGGMEDQEEPGGVPSPEDVAEDL